MNAWSHRITESLVHKFTHLGDCDEISPPRLLLLLLLSSFLYFVVVVVVVVVVFVFCCCVGDTTLTITDFGSGMSPQELERLLDPYTCIRPEQHEETDEGEDEKRRVSNIVVYPRPAILVVVIIPSHILVVIIVPSHIL